MATHSYLKTDASDLLPAHRGGRRRPSLAYSQRDVHSGGDAVRKEGRARPFLRLRKSSWRRGRPASNRILNWADAETVLATLGGVERELEQIDSLESEAIARTQAEADARRSIPARQRAALATALERFSRKQLTSRGDLTSVQVPKSRRLLFGRVGYRRSHAVLIRSESAALRSLAATREGRRFLRVTAALDREALRAFLMRETGGGKNGGSRSARGRLQRRLQRAGVRLARRDYWFYELNRETLGHWG